MRGVEDHLHRALDGIEALEPLSLGVSEAVGCILAEDAVAPEALPFDDIAAGETVLAAGALIGPRQAALLAGAGLASVRVRPRPRVVVITVGNSIVAPGRPLLSAEHRVDAVQDMLASAVAEAGGVAYHVGPLVEDIDVIANTVEDQLVRADLVVIASGDMAGPAASVVDALPKIGEVDVAEVALDPGTWQGVGRLGPDTTPVVLLSCEPNAAYVSFEIFVRPILRRMLGQSRVLRPVVRATLTEPFTSVAGRQHVVLGRIGVEDGRYVVSPVAGRGLKGLGSAADGLIVLAESSVTLAVGATVAVLRLDRP